MNEDMIVLYIDSGRKRQSSKEKYRHNRIGRGGSRLENQGFRCNHCQALVYGDTWISGVKNRNHCPYCLWSRHMDLHHAGDRLCACKAQMKPVGLAMKNIHKKYGRECQGELMMIHLCTDCGKCSINRIASDDDAEMVYKVFESSLELEPRLLNRIEKDGISPLQARDHPLVLARLFGKK